MDRNRRLAVVLTTAAALALPVTAASAAMTGTLAGTTATLTGSIAAEDVFISETGGLLRHNRSSSGEANFNSDVDWNTSVAGDQTVSSGSTTDVVVLLAGGNDTAEITTIGARTLTVDGGAGDDTLSGSPEVDTLQGGDGDDRVSGSTGADVVRGGAGDDVLTWSNGDGSDAIDGDEGFDRTIVTGANTAETYAIAPIGARTSLARTAPGAFTLDILSESVALETLAGDDAVTGSGAAPFAVDGGAGADTLTGGDGEDALAGGSGDDRLTGGAGADVLDGAEGNDTLLARDGAADLARCGAGTDSATLDAVGVDAATGCEALDQPSAPLTQGPPGPGPPAPVVPASAGVTAKQKLRPVKRTVKVAMSCPAGPAGCAGRLELVTLAPVRAGGARVIAQLGSAAFSLEAGQRKATSVKLPANFKSLAKRRAKELKLVAVVRNASGRVTRVPLAVRL